MLIAFYITKPFISHSPTVLNMSICFTQFCSSCCF